ncbi:MAG: sigma factor-like helix-turn-helix DNA-binding protein [Arenibacter troitsensis]|nr:sigma factor-like helix-turn-helix DNA-binding protein [Arenibacter troitsensis]
MSKKAGFKHKEIASQLNISEKAVEKHIGRATHILKQWLKEKKIVLCSYSYIIRAKNSTEKRLS